MLRLWALHCQIATVKKKKQNKKQLPHVYDAISQTKY